MNLFFSFFRLGLTAFGGPAMVAHIRALSIDRHRWLDEEEFKNGLALCQSIPGATAMQMAAYVGLKTRGISGALSTYVGFGFPSFIIMLIFSCLYARFHNVSRLIPLFDGLQVIVIAIIFSAVFTFGRNVITNAKSIIIALLSAFLFWWGISPFIVIILAGMTGVILYKKVKIGRSVKTELQSSTKRGVFICFSLFFLSLAGLYFFNHGIFELAKVMLKIDLFAFGGGFASLPLMLHEIVISRGWLDSKTFMDGLALGQITPGPIVITATFVGYLLYGLLGAFVATVAIFTPSFLVLITIEPLYDRLKNSAYFMKAVDGIVASFVGLLLFAGFQFAMSVSWDIVRMLFGLAALTALIYKIDILYVVLAGAVISIFLL